MRRSISGGLLAKPPGALDEVLHLGGGMQGKRMRLRIGTRGYEFRDFFDCCKLIGAGLRQKAEHHVLKGDHPDAQLDDLGIGKWRNIPFLAIGSERFLRPAGLCPAFVFPARQRPGFSRFRHMRFLS